MVNVSEGKMTKLCRRRKGSGISKNVLSAKKCKFPLNSLICTICAP